jgi:hypothetical protein
VFDIQNNSKVDGIGLVPKAHSALSGPENVGTRPIVHDQVFNLNALATGLLKYGEPTIEARNWRFSAMAGERI